MKTKTLILALLLGNLFTQVIAQETNPDSLFLEARKSAESKDYNLAISKINTLISSYPQNIDYTLYLARLYYWSEKFDLAQDQLLKIIEKTLLDVLSTYLIETIDTKDELIEPKIADNFEGDDFIAILNNIEKELGKDFVEMMLEIYRRRIPLDIIELEQALNMRDMDVIRSKAHLLAGSLSSLYFVAGTKLAKNVENCAFIKDYETIHIKTFCLIDYLNNSLKVIK